MNITQEHQSITISTEQYSINIPIEELPKLVLNCTQIYRDEMVTPLIENASEVLIGQALEDYANKFKNMSIFELYKALRETKELGGTPQGGLPGGPGG